MAVGIRLPNIPESAVPFSVEPDAMSVRAGLGFGGTASTARQEAYEQDLIRRGYSPDEASELAYLEERQAWKDRAAAGRGPRSAASNVDANLAAAATPITIDPEAGGIEARHAVRISQLVQQGVPREQAIVIAGREVVKEDGDRGDARAAARLASGYRDPQQTAYNAETFAEGYGFDENGNPAYLGRVDINNPSAQEQWNAGARRYQHRAPYNAEMEALNHGPGSDYVSADSEPARPLGMTEPGPVTLDGRPTRRPRPLNTPEEVEAYDVRPKGGLSQRDKDMAARGFVPVVTPYGVQYMRAAGDSQTPGGIGRAGRREDLLAKPDPHRWVVSEPGEYVGPDGRPVRVLKPGAGMVERQAAELKGRQAAYKEKKEANDKDRAEAKRMWRATAMLAGGSQNINSGNRAAYNQLAMLGDEDQQRALLYMSPGGQLAAGVDARNAEQAGKMAQSAMTAFLANNPGATEQQRAAAQMQNQNAEAQQSAAIQAEAESLVNSSADDQGWLNLPTRLVGGGVDGWDNTLLTIEEEEAAIRKLRAKYPHLTYEQALGHVEAAAANKTRQPRPAAGK